MAGHSIRPAAGKDAAALEPIGLWINPAQLALDFTGGPTYTFAPCAGVAQLVRASACHAEGRGFEPRRSRQFSRCTGRRCCGRRCTGPCQTASPPPSKARSALHPHTRTLAAGRQPLHPQIDTTANRAIGIAHSRTGGHGRQPHPLHRQRLGVIWAGGAVGGLNSRPAPAIGTSVRVRTSADRNRARQGSSCTVISCLLMTQNVRCYRVAPRP